MTQHAVTRVMGEGIEVSVVVDMMQTGVASVFRAWLYRDMPVERGQEKHWNEYCDEYPCRRLSLVGAHIQWSLLYISDGLSFIGESCGTDGLPITHLFLTDSAFCDVVDEVVAIHVADG